MMQSSRTGFVNAPFSKALLGLILLMNFMKAIIGRDKLEFSQKSSLILSVIQYGFSGHFVFSSTIELLLGCIVIYFFRLFERHWGTQKFAKFFLFTTYSSLILHYLLNWTLNQNRKSLISGPYGFMFAALVVYIFEIPPTAHMKIFNILPVSDKQTIYILVIQFLLTNFPHSLLPAVSGIISGTVYQYLLCNIFKLDRKLKFPAFLVKFASEVVKPLLQPNNYQTSSARPATSVNRNLGSSNQGNQQPQNIMHDNFMTQDHDQLSNLQGNVSEDNIQQLMNMGFSRTQCEIALRQANNDIHLATELLLHE